MSLFWWTGGVGQMGWDWANKNWNKRLGHFKKSSSLTLLQSRTSQISYQSKEQTDLSQVKKKTLVKFGTCFVPHLRLCVLLLPRWLSRCFWWQKRTRKDEGLLPVLNFRHRISLNCRPKQCLWEQKADADLEESSRASITRFITAGSFQAAHT